MIHTFLSPERGSDEKRTGLYLKCKAGGVAGGFVIQNLYERLFTLVDKRAGITWAAWQLAKFLTQRAYWQMNTLCKTAITVIKDGPLKIF